ncbi:amidophosphoribosyltransferase [Bradyrhizobium sp. USDA 4474]
MSPVRFSAFSSEPSPRVVDQLNKMIPTLALRGQAGVVVSAVMQGRGLRHGRAFQSNDSSVRIDCIDQDPGFQPHVAIAQIRSGSCGTGDGGGVQSIPSRHFAISLDGALVNAHELRSELLARGRLLDTSTDAELLLRWIEHACEREYWRHGRPVNYEAIFRDLDDRIDGALSALLLDKDGDLVAYRSRSGLRPLETMRARNGLLLFASENCAFAGLEGETSELLPGSIQRVDAKTGASVDHALNCRGYRAKLCAYEALYLGSPNTSVDGHSHRQTRYNIGLSLGRIVAERVKTDLLMPPIVSSMPNTGGPYADGLFDSLAEQGVVTDRIDVVATQFFERTLLGRTNARQSRIARKYRVSEPAVAERTVIIVDEALIRGDTSKAVTTMLLAAGAKAVHWAIGSPPIVAPNYYGMGIDTLDELAFWQALKRLPSELLAQCLRFHRMEPPALRIVESNIATGIQAASITYLPFRALVSVLANRLEGIDLSPFTFDMPTPAGRQLARSHLEALLATLPINTRSRSRS